MPLSPGDLFAASEAGSWYDPSDLSTLWKDTAGTSPVIAAGDLVARMDDKSGNGNHVSQATGALRPIFQLDGQGNPYLLFDGVDDWLRNTAASIGQPWDRISAIRQITHTSTDVIFGEGTLPNTGRLTQVTPSPSLVLYDGTANAAANTGLAVGANGVVTERHDGANSRLAINTGAYTTGNPGTTAVTGLTIGAQRQGLGNSHIRFYGCVMRAGTLTGSEIADIRGWYGDKAGLNLWPIAPRSYGLIF